jgi:hypothetical protein
VQSVRYTYVKKSIEDLFAKEDELLERITPFCNETGKGIEVNYFMSKEPPVSFTLEIVVKTEDEGES